jgi:hypothetical protein
MSTVNPLILVPMKTEYGLEFMPCLLSSPRCYKCGKLVERYEHEPVGCIYPFETFLCTVCEKKDREDFLYLKEQLDSGAWSEEQAEAYLMSLLKRDCPHCR